MSKSGASATSYSPLFVAIAMVFVATLVISNTVATKIISFGPLAVAAGIICFPVTYVINDIITEVYGFRRARFAVWIAFLCLALTSLLYTIATMLPPAPFYQDEAAFDRIFGLVPRIALGSLCGFLVGSLINAAVLSRLKVITAGRYLWVRTIGSTIIGEAADSLIFALIAFLGVFAIGDLLVVGLSGFLLKTAYEIVVTPLTYVVVRRVKEYEGVDTYDHDVAYRPF